MQLFQLLSQGLAPLTLISTLLAFFFPQRFLFIKEYFLPLFAMTMFCLGAVLSTAEVITTLKRPVPILWGVLIQFTVMPLLAFLATTLFDLPAPVAIGFILVGCAPGAMASNVIVYLAGGAVAYSIALTTVATFLSPLLTPTLVEFLGGVLVPIPFWEMVSTISNTVLLPLLGGLAIQHALPGLRTRFQSIAPAIASLSIILICSYAVAANADRISTMGPLIFAIVVIINGLGYFLGYQVGRALQFSTTLRITLAIEIGMQNAGLGVALALKHFPPETALPGAIFAVWCILTAAGAAAFLKKRSLTQEIQES